MGVIASYVKPTESHHTIIGEIVAGSTVIESYYTPWSGSVAQQFDVHFLGVFSVGGWGLWFWVAVALLDLVVAKVMLDLVVWILLLVVMVLKFKMVVCWRCSVVTGDGCVSLFSGGDMVVMVGRVVMLWFMRRRWQRW
ncbi:Hypothetical predicted protein [Olea europaea subsp. europaea]|uniref:Transmembrane protein n=1 Tax=Olea europaea subsp. europaea TaxID=158383 RepID=A0A8S0SM36_OLEEU|nr:Hypothetical predicted protein [Olea europaea subsp. europaea]